MKPSYDIVPVPVCDFLAHVTVLTVSFTYRAILGIGAFVNVVYFEVLVCDSSVVPACFFLSCSPLLSRTQLLQLPLRETTK